MTQRMVLSVQQSGWTNNLAKQVNCWGRSLSIDAWRCAGNV